MRRITLIVALLGVAWLASCNPKQDKKAETSGNAAQTSHPSSTPEEGGSTAVKLGFNFEETGPEATFGQSSHKGAQMALDEINAAGGLLGAPVEAVFDDNASDSNQAATVASKLVNQDKVNVLIGSVASSNSIAMAKIAEEAGVPMVTPASTRTTLTLNPDGTVMKYIYRTCFTDDFQGEGMADFAVNGPPKATKAVLFYDADSDYSIGIWETIKGVAAAKGLEIVAEDSYLGKSETDFRTRLSKFKGVDFDVMIVPGYYGQVGQIANQARELGMTQPLIGGDGWDSPDLWKTAGKNIEGCYFTNHYASDDEDPAVQEFITKYKTLNGGNIPDAMAILAYDTVKCVADAITRAGSADGDAVAKALGETNGFKGAAGAITINDKHNATKKLVVLEITPGGKYKWVYSYDPNAAGGDASAVPEEEAGAAPVDGADGSAEAPPAGS
jgi:branched-chain amino acid transport system substrate-binding protein